MFEEEPTSAENPLFTLDNVVCTPHVAGVSEEADRAIAVQVAGDMLRVLRGEKPRALANRERVLLNTLLIGRRADPHEAGTRLFA